MTGPSQDTRIDTATGLETGSLNRLYSTGLNQADQLQHELGLQDPRGALAYLKGLTPEQKATLDRANKLYATAKTPGLSSGAAIGAVTSDGGEIGEQGWWEKADTGTLSNMLTDYANTIKTKAGINSQFLGLEARDTPEFRKQLEEAATGQQQLADLGTKANELTMLGLAGYLSPEQEVALQRSQAYSRRTGMDDLNEQARNIAGSRGLRVGDSPVARDLLREQQRLGLGLDAQYSTNYLNQLNNNRNFASGVAQFQSGLQQQGLMNRLNIGQGTPSALMNVANLAFNRSAANQSTQQNYGGMDYLNAGMKVATGIGSMASSFGGGMPSFGGGLGLGGGGGAMNSTMYSAPIGPVR